MALGVHLIRLAGGALLLLPSLAAAQSGETLSLSEAQRADLLARNTEDSAAMARSGLAGGDRPARQVHGEIGAFVGTHGERGAYGVAAVPLGDHAEADIAVGTSRYGRPR